MHLQHTCFLPGQHLYQQSDSNSEYLAARLDFSVRLAKLQEQVKELSQIGDVDQVSGNGVCQSISTYSFSSCQTMFDSIGDYLATVTLLPLEYEYSEYLNVFIESCYQLHFLVRDNRYLAPGFTCSSVACLRYVVPDWIGFCQLLQSIYAKCRTVDFKSKLRRQVREANERTMDYCNYVNALFDQCARLVVLRIDLAYQKALAYSTSLELALADLERLFANMRNNRLFEFLEGYIVKTEYGIEKGIHFHLVLFFNGAERDGRKHIFQTWQIGKYWKEVITGGRGVYWNCNQQEKNYQEKGILGIGEIDWDDATLRDNLLNHVVGYVCKQEQCFKSKLLPRTKLIRRGQYPVEQEIRRGRPRQSGLVD